MKVACAQIRSFCGHVEKNVDHHLWVARQAAEVGVQVLVFPELSLTGYALPVARECEKMANDPIFQCLDDFGRMNNMLIIAGMPIKSIIEGHKPYIGALILGQSNYVEMGTFYAKMHIHGKEQEYFAPGTEYCVIPINADTKLGLSVCADLTEPSHAMNTHKAGACLYAVSALLRQSAFDKESSLLQIYAREHSMLVLLCNFARNYQGSGLLSVGKSSIWAPGGKLLVQAPEDTDNELLVVAEQQQIRQHDNDTCNLEWRGHLLPLISSR